MTALPNRAPSLRPSHGKEATVVVFFALIALTFAGILVVNMLTSHHVYTITATSPVVTFKFEPTKTIAVMGTGLSTEADWLAHEQARVVKFGKPDFCAGSLPAYKALYPTDAEAYQISRSLCVN